MARQPSTPVDRALAELDRRRQQLAEQARQLEALTAPATPPAGAGWVKEALRPPSRRMEAARRDLFDGPVAAPASAPVFLRTDPDLFATDREKPRKPLKHVERRNRQQFYFWLGAAVVVVLLLWLVLR